MKKLILGQDLKHLSFGGLDNASFPFGFEGEMWNLIVLVPDYCFSFYLGNTNIS